jgi:hypothetical protein
LRPDAVRRGAERVERLAERRHDRGRVVAALADERDERLVLGQRGPCRSRDGLLLGELRGRLDQLAERLEESELEIGRLSEERVDVGRELLEVDAIRAVQLVARAELELAPALTPLPEPPHHA